LHYEILNQQSGLHSTKIDFVLHLSPYIWAVTDRGYSLVPEGIDKFSNRDPLFYIKSVKVNNQLASLERSSLELPYNQNNLYVAFGFISFNNQNILVRHRLHHEDPWTQTTSRNLEFYALSPGTYDLEMEYSTDNVAWKPIRHRLAFIVKPPVYKTWYFQTAIALATLLIIFLYFRSRLTLYRYHQRKLMEAEIQTLEKERSRIAKDLHDSVGTDLSAIKMIVNQELQKYNHEKTNQIESHFQHTLTEIKNIIYNLNPPGIERYGLMSIVHSYVKRLNQALPIVIEVNSFGEEPRNTNVNITVFRILQELITNSVKHAAATKITLHLSSFDDNLNILYEDNGKGFAADSKKRGFGLTNIESRVQSLNGTIKFESGTFGVSYSIDIPITKPQ